MTHGALHKPESAEAKAWRIDYISAKQAYLSAKKTYLEGGTSTKADVDRLAAAQKKLMDSLAALESKSNAVTAQLTNSAAAIRDTGVVVEESHRKILYQDNDISKLNMALISKERQVQYTLERNKNRRIMIVSLILINIILISISYYIIKNNK